LSIRKKKNKGREIGKPPQEYKAKAGGRQENLNKCFFFVLGGGFFFLIFPFWGGGGGSRGGGVFFWGGGVFWGGFLPGEVFFFFWGKNRARRRVLKKRKKASLGKKKNKRLKTTEDRTKYRAIGSRLPPGNGPRWGGERDEQAKKKKMEGGFWGVSGVPRFFFAGSGGGHRQMKVGVAGRKPSHAKKRWGGGRCGAWPAVLYYITAIKRGKRFRKGKGEKTQTSEETWENKSFRCFYL